MTNNVLRLIGILVLASCAASCTNEIDNDKCITDYAQKGGTDQIVRWGYQLCGMATDAASSAKERDDALCAVRKIPSTPSELAFKQVIKECREK